VRLGILIYPDDEKYAFSMRVI